MHRYATRHGARHLRASSPVIALISLAFLASGCVATTGATTSSGQSVASPGGDGARPTPGTIATYGALTGVGVGAATVGAYFMADAERSPDRTGSRPEFWGGFQAAVGGAALAVPFGYLTARSLFAEDAASADAGVGRPATDVARDRGGARRAGRGVTLVPHIGPGSVDVSGSF